MLLVVISGLDADEIYSSSATVTINSKHTDFFIVETDRQYLKGANSEIELTYLITAS